MRLQRRQFLHLAAGAATLAASTRRVCAQSYPSRPLRLIVGYPAGGPTDIAARIIGQWLSEHLGQQVIIDNRPGASGNIATEAALRAPADGYTLLLLTVANAINATIYEKQLSFDLVRDLTPVAGVVEVPEVLDLNPSVPATTVPEFIAYAKANPGRINMASAGTGTSVHVAGELFKMMAGVDMIHVPYRGSAPAVTDLVGGQVQVMFDVMSSSVEYIRAGKLHALAVTTKTRSPALPDLPTVAQFLPGYESSYWTGIVLPARAPGDIVEKLNREINAGLADPKVKAQFANLGATPLSGSPAAFGDFIGAETVKWAKVVRMANVRPE
jgi:tripartite-type tricarboxylate transporter receptor subunit TctC